jgi:ATP-binding cassette subfamily B protein
VERDDERKAFARAWSYLNYNATAKWASLLSGVGTGLLYVALLVLLWLFADLMVHRGSFPSYADLPRPDRERFQDTWRGLPPNEQKEYLERLGLPEPVAQPVASAAAADLDKLDPPDRQALVWRGYLNRTLCDRVDGAAGALVLPAFRDLPDPEQRAFASYWKQWPEKGATLNNLGFEPDLVQELDRADDLLKLPQERREVAWRVAQYGELQAHSGWAGAGQEADSLRERLKAAAANPAALTEADRDALTNHGFLGLVVRSDVRNNLLGPSAGWLARANPYRAASPFAGWAAHWNPWAWRHGNLWYLIGLLVLAVLLGLLHGVLTFVAQDAAARASTEAATRLRRAVYHHTFRLGTLAFRALGPGEAVSIFTRHVEAVHEALFLAMTVLWRQPIKFGLLLAFALLIHPLLAVAFLLAAFLIWMVGTQVAAGVRREGRAATARAAEQLTLIRESLMLMRLVKTYLMELFNQSRVERQLARYAAFQLRRYRGEAFYRALLTFLGLLAGACLLFVAGLLVLHDQLGVASGIALAAALVSLYWPLQAWLENRRLVRRGRESAVTLFQFLDRPGEVGQVVGAEFLAPLANELEFDNVSLQEPGSNRMLLQDVSLTIKAGQRIGIVGPEELEKHALVYLLPRFLDPTAGEIRIDEHNLRWVTLDSLRAQIALVMMHNLVFHDTVANNIGCGDPGYTLPQIIEAAKVAHAHHFIQRLPKGYETPIGELGHALSLSEQFRIALARAVLRDPALLIIEEPDAPMDEDSKALLDDSFARILPGRTAIFLPHRISTLKSCDRIFLLHKGRLEAVGDHRGLLSQSALYRHLHYLEFNEIAEQV